MEDRPVKTWQSHLKSSLLVFSIGIFFNAISCIACLRNLDQYWLDFVFTGIFWMVLWKGNEWVAGWSFGGLNWQERPTGRLLVGVLGHCIYTFLAAVVLTQILSYIQNGEMRTISSFGGVLRDHLPAIFIALVISLFMTARAFLYNWREVAIQNEKLKTESMASRFASLKAQVNPHFLFNSLNVLSGLVYRDTDLSAQFIKKLSEVYRYVLDQQEQELVPVGEELEFVESIVFLQQIRFGDNLKVSIDVQKDNDKMIAPLALQMLIENAIKHNVISAQSPLDIQIKENGHYYIVSNTLQPKTVMGESLGLGLENIRKRYGFLTNRAVEVLQEQGQFIVKLPIIQVA
ncbi:MAG: histidine kinase [Saprospiraceae bacterium]|nr:histidine kinase [Saprospiraceae bacterium]